MNDSSAEQRAFWDNDAITWDPSDAVETNETTPMLDFLADLAGPDGRWSSASVPEASPSLCTAAVSRSPESTSPRHDQRLTRQSARRRPSRNGRQHGQRRRSSTGLPAGLHHRERYLLPYLPRRTDRLLPQRRTPPSTRRPPRDLPLGATTPRAAPRPNACRRHRHRQFVDYRQLRRRRPTRRLPPLQTGRRQRDRDWPRPRHRYIWPSEMDVMATRAGLELAARYADWSKSDFTAESRTSISVWRKPAR